MPLYPQVQEMAEMGLIPGGSRRNRDYYLPKVLDGHEPTKKIVDIVCDPQTSGGLLISVPAGNVNDMLERLDKANVSAWIVGTIVEGKPGTVRIR